MNRYDRILKENIGQLITPLLDKILGVKALKVEELTTDLQVTLERRPDFTKRVMGLDEQPFILHVEFQSNDETDMLLRMQTYYALLQEVYKLPVHQFVLYLGEGKSRMQNQAGQFIPGSLIPFSFPIIQIQDYDYRTLLQSDIPEELILAVLGNFKGEAPEGAIGRILKNLQKAAKSKAKLEKYVRQLAIMARLRNLTVQTNKLIKTMPINYDIEQDYLYQEGIKEGVDKGSKNREREMITEMLKAGLSLEQVAVISKTTTSYVQEIQKELTQS